MESKVMAWRPPVTGIREVLHAHFPAHAYPSHVHDAWTLMVLDQGVVRYGLDQREHGVINSEVTVLPPQVPHDGRSVRPGGFSKRVIYLEPDVLPLDLIGAAVDHPGLVDPVLRQRLHQLHKVLAQHHENLEAESRLTLIKERLGQHLTRRFQAPQTKDPSLAVRLRELLDARTAEGITLAEAAGELHAHPAHLVRAFSKEFGLPPHRYLTGRRVDLARRYLLDGQPAGEVAVRAGFYDQSHLNRHFRRLLGVSPVAFVRP
ncbi:helix-turn-helix transcriptional regulator [Kribbella deserti]|uniref:AraC family transcriptional regulator n=1 Tax=Kribbella deserti TaxID=1926257 RepID=A0ABV6QRP8_9ACTN